MRPPIARAWRPLVIASFTLTSWAVCLRADTANTVAALEPTTVRLFRDASPAVVRVKVVTENEAPGGRGPRPPSVFIYSGFFINREGRIVTNAGENNAMARASRIWIEKDGLPYLADLVGSDPRSNIALLQVVKMPAGFGAIPLEPLDEPLPIGTPVVAVTSPLSFDPSPSAGLVTGYESNFEENVFPFTYARVNIPGGPAEGGSPVLDHSGHLVGISVASLPQIGSSYLVPTRALARIVDELSNTGRVAYPALPIEYDEYPDSQSLGRQVMVSRVEPDSSASRAGLRVGDVIRRAAGTNIRRLHDLRDAIFFTQVGEYIQIEIERDGRLVPFALPVEARKQQAVPIAASPPPVTTPEPPPPAPPADSTHLREP